jgi:hypothetical protein
MLCRASAVVRRVPVLARLSLPRAAVRLMSGGADAPPSLATLMKEELEFEVRRLCVRCVGDTSLAARRRRR